MVEAAKNSECVKVVVRCRPLSTKETNAKRKKAVQVDGKSGQITIKGMKKDQKSPVVKTFTFDQVYDESSTQSQIYQNTAKPIVQSSIDGYNGTIFAYGQTGTGKSHTMEGKDDPPELRGIIPNSCCHIFEEIARSNNTTEFLVRASYIEIYNEEIRDLLSKNPQNRLELKENPEKGVYVKGLTAFVVKGVKEILNVITVGKRNRTVGETLMNQDSSRSHAIFMITIESSTIAAPTTGQASPGMENKESAATIRVGKLNLVDLAGSERQSKTGATGDRLKEATKINLSLSALGNVISALVDGKGGHIPYRDSKLTRMLQDSLGGNTKTLMIANVGPADMNFEETLSTLRYANRAKNIKNKPKINEDPKDAMLREFQEEIARLKAQLAGKGVGPGGPGGSPGGPGSPNLAELKEQMRSQMRDSIKSKLVADISSKARKELEAKAQQEIEEISKSKAQTEEEKEKIQRQLQQQKEELDAYANDLQNEQIEKENMEKRLKAMESKVIHGDVNLVEKQEELEKVMNEQQQEYKKHIEHETEQQKRINELEDMQKAIDEQYANVQDELEIKTRKIKRMVTLYRQAKDELEDLQEEVQQEREDLLDNIRVLTQQLKLKDLTIASYIPPEHQQRIVDHSEWDEEEETWIIAGSQYSGNALRATRENSLYEGDDRSDQGSSFPFENHAYNSSSVMSGLSEKLQNVYFSYKENFSEVQDASRGIQDMGGQYQGDKRRPSSVRRPSSATRRASVAAAAPSQASKASRSKARRSSVQLDLRDATNLKEQNASRKKSVMQEFPKARGIVKNTRR
ncbi:kinesin-like protein [Chloropicon primus]|uniref:Kinesin-like protein n=2 Tax=Chloropicon primus TaxID=1764295 RepID=A0A5B8MGP9_9CHLO|nr:kinesin-like protein [Chloropicon primus]|eukprot:QDZ18855.1 kinesin-like protein [Chloropicon primus]